MHTYTQMDAGRQPDICCSDKAGEGRQREKKKTCLAAVVTMHSTHLPKDMSLPDGTDRGICWATPGDWCSANLMSNILVFSQPLVLLLREGLHHTVLYGGDIRPVWCALARLECDRFKEDLCITAPCPLFFPYVCTVIQHLCVIKVI